MLEVRGLSTQYGDRPVLDRVDLDVADGEIVCVLGPSGSGKTTLLRAIGGLEPLTAGRVLRDGVDLAGVPPHRRALGLMFQDHTLFPHRDVLGNVAGIARSEHFVDVSVDDYRLMMAVNADACFFFCQTMQ